MARALQLAQQGPLPGRVPENRQNDLVLYAGGDTFDSALPGRRLQLIAPHEHRICTGREFQAQKKPPVGGFTTLLIALIILLFPMVAGVGLEPTQRERRGILNPLCLPIPPSGLGKKVEARSGVEPD